MNDDPSASKNRPFSRRPGWLHWVIPSTAEVIFLTLVLVMIFGPPHQNFFVDGDAGWHIRAGQYMLETHSIPHHDIFSYTMPKAWWVTWEWGTEIIFALLHRFFGLSGVAFFTVLLFAGSYTLLYKFLRNDGVPFLLAFPLVAFVVSGSLFHWAARPHAVSFVFVVLYFHVLDRFVRGKIPAKRLWILPLLMILWVNLHAGFIAGIILALTFWASSILNSSLARGLPQHDDPSRSKQLGIAAAGCVLASLVNPNGYGLYVYIYEYFKTVHFLNPLNELSSPSFQMAIFQPFLVALIFLLFLLRYSRYKPGVEEILTLAGWSGLALISLRNIPIMLLICAPIFARLMMGLRDPLNRWLSHWVRFKEMLKRFQQRIELVASMERNFDRHLLSGFILAALAIVVANQGFWRGRPIIHFAFNERYYSEGEFRYLKTHMPSGNMFNEWVMGGYLIYHFYPHIRVFVDGRMDMYGETFTRQYANLINTPEGGNGAESWQTIFRRYNIRWAVLRPDLPLCYALASDPNWKVSYRDTNAVLFVLKTSPGR